MTAKRLAILGSTGSIGRQTLDVVAAFPDRFSVVALTANASWQEVAEQVRRFNVPQVAMGDREAAARLQENVGPAVRVLQGEAGIVEMGIHPDVDMTVVALVGCAGLLPTMRALEAGKDVALVNKEALVVGGALMMEAARRAGRRILPVDSEHSAIFQCLEGEDPNSIARIVLTCSGGPFRKMPAEEMATVTVSQALAHPNWKMGSKITIDSATLMNKGFEVLEAHHLYGVPLSKIDVIVHPESIIHSMVEFVDGSVKAQLCPPDMRLPIMYALGYPERLARNWRPTDFAAISPLTFEAPRRTDFPCLDLAYQAGVAGGVLPAVLNAANEVAVDLFLKEKIRFSHIAEIIQRCMTESRVEENPNLDDLLRVDRETRVEAQRIAGELMAAGKT